MADVKEQASSYGSPSQGSGVTPPQQDWSPKEEQRARIKYIMPLTLFLFIARLCIVVPVLIALCNCRLELTPPSYHFSSSASSSSNSTA